MPKATASWVGAVSLGLVSQALSALGVPTPIWVAILGIGLMLGGWALFLALRPTGANGAFLARIEDAISEGRALLDGMPEHPQPGTEGYPLLPGQESGEAAAAFVDRSLALLDAHHGAWLRPTFIDALNGELREARGAGVPADESEPIAERVKRFAERNHAHPRRIVEAALTGLSEARATAGRDSPSARLAVSPVSAPAREPLRTVAGTPDKPERARTPDIVPEEPRCNSVESYEGTTHLRLVTVPFVNQAEVFDAASTASNVIPTIEVYRPGGDLIDRAHGRWRELDDVTTEVPYPPAQVERGRPISLAPDGQRHLLDVIAQDYPRLPRSEPSRGCYLVREPVRLVAPKAEQSGGRLQPGEYRVEITLRGHNIAGGTRYSYDLTVPEDPADPHRVAPKPTLELRAAD